MTSHVNATLHRSTRTKYCWHISTHSRQNHPWCNLITVRNVENPVKPVGIDNCFCRIGNQFTRWKTVTHPNMPHGNPIVHTNGIKLKRNTTSLTDSFFGNICQFTQVNMPWNNINIRVTNSNEGLLHILGRFNLPSRIQKSACWCLINTNFDHITSHDVTFNL